MQTSTLKFAPAALVALVLALALALLRSVPASAHPSQGRPGLGSLVGE